MQLDPILLHAPCAIFWKDLNGKFLGCNKLFLTMSGAQDYNELIGKKDADMRWKAFADKYTEDDKYVIDTGKMITIVEDIPVGNGIVTSQTTKGPLIENGKIIGVIGTCLDITDRKEAERLRIEVERKEVERLKLENDVHKQALYEQTKFTKLADQVAHDIRSPIASLGLIIESLAKETIPERERLGIKDALGTMNDIVNELLEFSRIKDASESHKKEKREVMFVSANLLQLLSAKKSEYKDMSVKFDYEFNKKAYTAFIRMEPTEFKRSLSNIINNAVNAFDGGEGKVLLKLEATKTQVKIIIQDNGKGIPTEVIDKIMNNIAVTHNKQGGHGIGFTQIHGTLERNEGKLSLDSKIGKGTKIVLTFPRIEAPKWFAEEVTLGIQDIIVILDDDSSIHTAWDVHFKEILENYPLIQLKHFEKGQEALDFISNLNNEDKAKIFLLTDYELLKQNLSGLDVIEQAKVDRSLLVTSHYANPEIQEQAVNFKAKIVPKQSASEIPISVDENLKYTITHKKTDLVIIDDDKKFTDILVNYVFMNKEVDCYDCPRKFLEHADQYPKDTKICIDHNFASGAGMNGLMLAEDLHNKGFNNLYMLSGEIFEEGRAPAYLTIILKTDIDGIRKI